MKLTISPVGTTYIKSNNHDKYSRLEPSQGLNPARVGKKTIRNRSTLIREVQIEDREKHIKKEIVVFMNGKEL